MSNFLSKLPTFSYHCRTVEKMATAARDDVDEVAKAIEKVRSEWDGTFAKTMEHVRAIEVCGTLGKGTEEASSLPRLNGLARDGLSVLRSLQFGIDLLAQQMPTQDGVQEEQKRLESWKKQYQR